MTDVTPTSPHLDDEALVALLDSEASGAEARAGSDHLGVCAPCRERRDELAAASELLASPVEPLPADMADALVLRALAGATDGGADADRTGASPAAVPLAAVSSPRATLRARSGRLWSEPLLRAAAAIVVVAGLGAGAYVATRSIGSGQSSQDRAAAEQPPAHGSASGAGGGPAPILEFRPVGPGTPASCQPVWAPDPNAGVSLPDEIDRAGSTHGCLALDPALVTVRGPAPAAISGPTGLSGPDTLTVELPANVSRRLPPGEKRIVAVADGAVIGEVTSVRPEPGGKVVVVIASIDPAVAEYLYGVLQV